MTVGRPPPNKIHPKNIVDAQFSAYYQVALSWLDGSETWWSLYDRSGDDDAHELLDKVTV
jgi:2-methylcitrate dehydratase PrpD